MQCLGYRRAQREVAAFDAAMREAHAYLYADPERARKAVSDYSGLDPAFVNDMPLISWKSDVNVSAWQAVADMMFRQGKSPNITMHLNTC